MEEHGKTKRAAKATAALAMPNIGHAGRNRVFIQNGHDTGGTIPHTAGQFVYENE